MAIHHVSENAPLLKYLEKAFAHSSRKRLKKLLESGAILVNNQTVTEFTHPLQRGDAISIHRNPIKTQVDYKFRLDFPIVFEDSAVILIDKPEGLLSVATDHIKIHTAHYKVSEYIRSMDPKRKKGVFIVHRLDRDVSGLLLFAKTEKAKEFLQNNWKLFDKKYYAIVDGRPKKESGTIESYLTEDKFRRVYSTRKSEKSKLCVTHYRVLEAWGKYSLLEISLETGRKNQIRVHLADMGNPIIGDEKYDCKSDPIKRLGLHAYHLSFEHPVTHEKKVFTAPLPQSFYALRVKSTA